jgi:hypothetical protein
MAARSPNYPAADLGSALSLIEKAFKAENRNKMSQTVLAGHMGYGSLNGRALGKIGAVRAYGLVEGRGDDLKVSDDAITALMADAHSDERKAALERLALQPKLFKDLKADFPDTLPSEKNLIFHLVKRGFTQDAAGKAAKTYLATMRLVSENPASYVASDEPEDDTMTPAVETSGSTNRQAPPATSTGKDELSVLLKGNRLHITANVDPEGLERLKQMLDKYTEILKLVQQ